MSFSLRTLLLATTLLCVILGRGVYLQEWRAGLGEYMRARSIQPESWEWTIPWSQPWKREAAFLLTGNSMWIGTVPKDLWYDWSPQPVTDEFDFFFGSIDAANSYDPQRTLRLCCESLELDINGDATNLVPSNESELLLPIDNEGVRYLRDTPFWKGRLAVQIGDRKLTATDAVLAEASPIPVESLELDSGQTRWLKLFGPGKVDWSGPMTPADRLELENCPSLIRLEIFGDVVCEAELAQSPKLCRALRWATIDADKSDLAAWRSVISQSPFLRRLEINSAQVDETLQALGPLPRKIGLMKLNLRDDNSSSTGRAVTRAMANQQSGWELEVNYEQLSDEDLIAIFKIPHLTRLKCDGAFSARGLAALQAAKSLQRLELHVTQIDSTALLDAVKQSQSLHSLRLRGVDVPQDTLAKFRAALNLRPDIQTAQE